MATFRKVGKRWRAEVRQQGVTKSKNFASKGEAQAWARFQEKIVTGGDVAHDISFKAVCIRYLKEQSQRKGARWESVRIHKLLNNGLDQYMLGNLTPQFWKQWILEQTISPASIRRELSLLGSVFRECIEWGYLSEPPLRDVKQPSKTRSRDRVITDLEIEQINDYLTKGKESSQQIRAAFNLALATGMRRGEILSLEWSQIDLERRFLRLNDTKNGDKRDVPLSSHALSILTAQNGTDGRLFTVKPDVLSSTFRKVCKRLEIEDLRFHDTRHRAVMDLAKKLSVIELARVIGHRDLKSLMIYYHPSAEDLAKLLD